MKLYILGAPGSGKTTLAREISRRTGMPCFHLDEVMHEPDPNDPGNDRKRDPEKRDKIFLDIISRESWIIEDAGRACFREGQMLSDRVILLSLPRPLLLFRVLRRWLRQRAGIEKAQYRPDMSMLRMMRKWVVEYDAADHAFLPEKTRILKNPREIRAFINDICQ